MAREKKGEQSLEIWQERLRKNQSASQAEFAKMTEFEQLYNGSRSVTKVTGAKDGKPPQEAGMVRNIVAELVEAQVDSSIPMPKVTARRQEDEELAKSVEDYLRNELDRLPFEQMNDMEERISPVAGGDCFLVEWDADRHTHFTRGELSVRLLHPRQVIFQDGVTEINDMDYVIVRIAMSKAAVKAKYKIDVADESESDPMSRGASGTAEDVVTVNYGYFRNKAGGIGRYTWVNDTVLEDMDDYQARYVSKCTKCGQQVLQGVCSYCGNTKSERTKASEFPLLEDLALSGGQTLPAFRTETVMPMEGMQEIRTDPFSGEAFEAIGEEQTVQTTIPYYKPDVYPIVIRKNVSAWGKVLGDSDVEKIKDQQNAIKKCDTRIQEKLDMGGSVLVKHQDSKLETTDRQLKIMNIEQPMELNCFRVINLQVDSSLDRAIAEDCYQSARNIIGITDSFQGRQDRTATSGTAKQIAVAQSAGRLESKRIMKNAMYADLFQVMFKFLLAYSDEPRAVRHSNIDGQTEYGLFNKMDFLRQDEAGALYWVDDFLFDVDNSSALASNRESMWQETRMNLEKGAFGNPADLKTLILFWGLMATLHYPMATEIKQQLEAQQRQFAEQEMQQVTEGNGMQEDAQMQGIPQEILAQMGGLGNGM